MAVEEEQLDHRQRMNAGIVANVAIGPMSVELVEAVAEEAEAAQETVEVDLRKYGIKDLTKFLLEEETDSKEEAVLDALEVDQEMMVEGPESWEKEGASYATRRVTLRGTALN